MADHAESVADGWDQFDRAMTELALANRENANLKGALRYIASPTLGRPGGTDAAEFVRQGGGSEHAIRTALAYCITLAQQVLDPEHNDGSTHG